jgi:pyrroline-5-carboxylate reductase
MKTIGFIGGGRITRIFLQAFESSGVRFRKVYIYDKSAQAVEKLNSLFENIEVTDSDASKAASSDYVFIALHPADVEETINSIKNFVKRDSLIISLAPKITIDKLAALLPDFDNICRMNPNAGTLMNDGFNPVCFKESINKNIKKDFLLFIEEFGQAPEIEENKLEAYAVISAMGHTYFWFQLQHLKELAISFGLSDFEAKEAITAMMHGTTATLFDSELNYDQVVDLLPVKPMAEAETEIKAFYDKYLPAIFNKIKP